MCSVTKWLVANCVMAIVQNSVFHNTECFVWYFKHIAEHKLYCTNESELHHNVALVINRQ